MSSRATPALIQRKHAILVTLVLGGLLCGYATALAKDETSAVGPPPERLFEHYEVVIGKADRQTVLAGSLLGGDTADLAVLHIDKDYDRQLRIYAFGDGTWVQRLDATLGPHVMFVDVANIGGRDRLITYQRGRLNWFDPDSATERLLAEVATSYNSTASGLGYAGIEAKAPVDEGEIPHVDLTRDLNGDARDDLILPDVDGFWVLIQMSDGGFTDPVKLGPPEPFRDQIAFGDKRSYGDVGISPLTIPWYLSRVYEMDYDQDGRSDLVFWNEDHFDAHRQDARGMFSPVAETFTVDVPFDSDGAYSLLFGFSGESTFSLVFGLRKSTKRTLMRTIRDVNGDHVADLVTHSLEGRSLLRQRSRYEVYFGTPTPDGIVFASQASTVIQAQGKAAGVEQGGYSALWFQDFDGDGLVDILRGDVKIGLVGMIRALLGTSISMGYELYSMADGVYPDKPTTRGRFKADLDIRGGRDAGFFPSVLVGDVNGDGRSDVLVGRNREELHVFLGGPELLAGQARRVAVDLPGDERNSWLVDLNKDGKQDLLMHHPSTTEPHRVTVLIAQ